MDYLSIGNEMTYLFVKNFLSSNLFVFSLVDGNYALNCPQLLLFD